MMAIISGYVLTELLGAIIFTLGGFYLYFKLILYNYWRKHDIVYLEPSVPMGNLSEVVAGKKHISVCFQEAYEKLKKNRLFGMYTFYKPSLVIADPDLIRSIMTKEFSHFHDRGVYCNEKVDPLTGHIFSLPGQKWRKLRVKLTPTFTSGKMKQMFGTIKERGDFLSKFLENKARDKSVVEIKDTFARYATDVIMTTAFGVDCNSLTNPDCEFRYWGKKVFDPAPVKNAFSFFAPKVMDFFQIPFFPRDVHKFFMSVFKNNVEYRISNNERRRDFMDLLVQLINTGYVEGDDEKASPHISESTDGKITLEEGAAQAFVFYLAGFETSSTTAAHCIYELAQNQEIQDKVREEINTKIKEHGDLTYDSLNEMSYLHKVICETLRIHPPVGILNRVCTKDIDLPKTNLHVSRGVDVVIPVLAIHRDPDIYPDPMKFDPERFNEKNIADRHPYTYLPFGEGPRICIGLRFGLAQTKVALINTLKNCRYTLAPNQPVPYIVDPGSLIYGAEDINVLVEPL